VKVTVLGCGPAGMVATHAAISLGYKVDIVSSRFTPSELYGCQYLHAPIPGFEGVQNVMVKYDLRGTPEEYRNKVYGDRWKGKVSPEDFVGEHMAWDIRETYRLMWQTYAADVAILGVDHRFITQIEYGKMEVVRRIHDGPIISTIPARNLCEKGHLFRSHTIYAKGDMQPSTTTWRSGNRVVCDGTDEVDWYRTANVFGYRTTEWSLQSAPIPDNAARVLKPLSHECDCNSDIIRVGRYGAWDKSYLVHQVYGAVLEALK
jgi:hypothetical protein